MSEPKQDAERRTSRTLEESSSAACPVCHLLCPAIPFTREMLERVGDFDCGGSDSALEVSNWIKAPRGSGGALDEMEQYGTSVWLYEDTARNLVGFGSLGVTSWRYPNPKKSDKIEMHIVPFYGVQRQFHKLPPGDYKRHYSYQIFSDLIAKAIEWPEKHRWLCLCVSPSNTKAIRLYEEFGFVFYREHKGRNQLVLDLRPT